jgi:hypothetical protein
VQLRALVRSPPTAVRALLPELRFTPEAGVSVTAGRRPPDAGPRQKNKKENTRGPFSIFEPAIEK